MAISEDRRHPTQYLPNSQCTQITLIKFQFSSETLNVSINFCLTLPCLIALFDRQVRHFQNSTEM